MTTIFLRHNISRIRWSGNDIESVSKLIDTSKRQADKLNIDLTSTQTILQSINKTFNHLTVHIQDIDKSVCFIGQIHEMDDDSIVIHEFGTKSSLDRKFILLGLDDITRIDAGGQYENNLKRLFNEWETKETLAITSVWQKQGWSANFGFNSQTEADRFEVSIDTNTLLAYFLNIFGYGLDDNK
jgi:hypothetical protein